MLLTGSRAVCVSRLFVVQRDVTRRWRGPPVVCVLLCVALVCRGSERERTRPATHPGGFAQDFDPLGLKPEDPEALKEMQTKESRAASRITTLLFVCVASMAWPCVVCLLWLFVCRVCRGSMRENSCLCVVVVCRAHVSRLDERTRSATHPGGFAQAPARPPRNARRGGHDCPGAPDGRHALLSAEDGPTTSTTDAASPPSFPAPMADGPRAVDGPRLAPALSRLI